MHLLMLIPTITPATNTNMRLFTMAASITPLLLLTLSFEANARPYDSYARVTQVTPIYETYAVREPYQECHLEKQIVEPHIAEPRKRHHRNTSTTPTIVGALIGGAIGNELGHNKSNKRVGAVAGAILGGSIANDLTRQSRSHHPRHHPRHRHNSYATTEKVCTTHYNVRHEKQVTAYDVNYKYQGQTYSTVMNTHPGRKIRVTVDVKPIGY